jgi:hypothetical protein
MKAQRKAARRFRVGDWVSFAYGPRRVWAQVIEDRGPLGVNRRRVYRVRLDQDGAEPLAFEMPEDYLERAGLPDRESVLRYLKDGGLVALLRANLGGGEAPRAWLTYSPRGEVSHTFAPERGLLGGAAVPFFALHEGKVFVGKRQAVLDFLTTFGLTREEGEAVVRAVGTAP